MKQNLLRRIIASTDGAFLMAFIYIAIIGILSILEVEFYQLSSVLQIIVAPATLITGITPVDNQWLGIPLNTLFYSLIIYVAVGYLIDWLVDPYN